MLKGFIEIRKLNQEAEVLELLNIYPVTLVIDAICYERAQFAQIESLKIAMSITKNLFVYFWGSTSRNTFIASEIEIDSTTEYLKVIILSDFRKLPPNLRELIMGIVHNSAAKLQERKTKSPIVAERIENMVDALTDLKRESKSGEESV